MGCTTSVSRRKKKSRKEMSRQDEEMQQEQEQQQQQQERAECFPHLLSPTLYIALCESGGSEDGKEEGNMFARFKSKVSSSINEKKELLKSKTDSVTQAVEDKKKDLENRVEEKKKEITNRVEETREKFRSTITDRRETLNKTMEESATLRAINRIMHFRDEFNEFRQRNHKILLKKSTELNENHPYITSFCRNHDQLFSIGASAAVLYVGLGVGRRFGLLSAFATYSACISYVYTINYKWDHPESK